MTGGSTAAVTVTATGYGTAFVRSFPAYQALVDIDMSPDGDVVVSQGDLALARGIGVIQDDIIIRTLTETMDFAEHPWLGASLQDFFGAPNTQQTGDRVRSRLLDALLRDANLLPEDTDVVIVPVGTSLLLFVVVGEETVVETFELSLTSGLRRLEGHAR